MKEMIELRRDGVSCMVMPKDEYDKSYMNKGYLKALDDLEEILKGFSKSKRKEYLINWIKKQESSK